MTLTQERIIEETNHLSLSELRALASAILEEIREREWDEIWDRTLASPESIRYQDEELKQIEERIARGEKALTLEDLEKLCQEPYA
jgi:hypothetical protein